MNTFRKIKISYTDLFRLTYVGFMLYLLGDAIHRWSGFRFYGSFADFLASAALITILWSIVALCCAFIIWGVLRLLIWIRSRSGKMIKEEHALLFVGIFSLLGAISWIGRAIIQRNTSIYEEIAIVGFVIIGAAIFTRIYRNRSETLIKQLLENITPLVWLFGIWTVVSFLLCGYYIGIKYSKPLIAENGVTTSLRSEKRPNIVLLTFDTLTTEDMSLYGYHRQTTPFIDKWAKTATVFNRLQAEDNITKPTTSSMMTGKRVWTHQSYHNIEGSSSPLRSSSQNLALVLKNHGYFTMGFIANPFASLETLDIADSYDLSVQPHELKKPGNLISWIDNVLYRYLGNKIALYNWIIKDGFLFRGLVALIGSDLYEAEMPPDLVFNRFLEVLDNKPEEPYFAWLHVFPPHAPYLPPEPYYGMFDSRLAIKNIEDPVLRRARYDEFIRYCDNRFEYFIGELAKRNHLKDTIIILTSDHGESFEHNYIGHGGPHLYEQVTHIPLIIKDVDQTRGRVNNNLVEQIDIPSTILDLADISIPDWIEGRSLVPAIEGNTLQSKPIYAMNLEKNYAQGKPISAGTIAVWKDEYKLIYYISEKKSLLFNLEEDPSELNNLFENEREIGNNLLSLIQNELKKANKRIAERK